MTLNNAVISGNAKLVLYDNRNNSPTKGELMEIFLGEDNYILVKIPPGLFVRSIIYPIGLFFFSKSLIF